MTHIHAPTHPHPHPHTHTHTHTTFKPPRSLLHTQGHTNQQPQPLDFSPLQEGAAHAPHQQQPPFIPNTAHGGHMSIGESEASSSHGTIPGEMMAGYGMGGMQHTQVCVLSPSLPLALTPSPWSHLPHPSSLPLPFPLSFVLSLSFPLPSPSPSKCVCGCLRSCM